MKKLLLAIAILVAMALVVVILWNIDPFVKCPQCKRWGDMRVMMPYNPPADKVLVCPECRLRSYIFRDEKGNLERRWLSRRNLANLNLEKYVVTEK